MNNYFYDSKNKEYFSIISKDNIEIDISVITPKDNTHKVISENFFSRRCFSVKKFPANSLLNKKSFSLVPDKSSDNKVTFLGNTIINYDKIDESEFMISLSNNEDQNQYDIVTVIDFKDLKETLDYISIKSIIDDKYTLNFQNFNLINTTEIKLISQKNKDMKRK